MGSGTQSQAGLIGCMGVFGQGKHNQSSENSSRQTHQPNTSRYTPGHIILPTTGPGGGSIHSRTWLAWRSQVAKVFWPDLGEGVKRSK